MGKTIRQWIVSTLGSDTIHLDRRTNLWGILRQNLQTPSEPWRPLPDRSEYISIELLAASARPTWNIPSEAMLVVHEESRFCVSPAGQNAIRRYLENQLRNAFRVYMVARFSDSDDEPIQHAIASFLLDFGLPCENGWISKLAKDWYRYREKNDRKYHIPIFF